MKYDVIGEALNDVAMNGLTEEEYGSCEVEGFWAALIIADVACEYHDATYPESLCRDVMPLVGIIEETDQGFVDYELFSTEQAARDRWELLTNIWEHLYHPEAAYGEETDE